MAPADPSSKHNPDCSLHSSSFGTNLEEKLRSHTPRRYAKQLTPAAAPTGQIPDRSA
jgi:hypothetical protein